MECSKKNTNSLKMLQPLFILSKFSPGVFMKSNGKGILMWSKNARASTILWLTLYQLGELNSPFNRSGGMRMQELFYWNSAADEELRQAEAKQLADEMDSIFTGLRMAEYRSGVEQDMARYMLKDYLLRKDTTLSEMADKADEYYVFRKGGRHEN